MTQSLLHGSYGLNTNADPASLLVSDDGKAFLLSCDNVFIGDTGRINRCYGSVLIYSGNVHTVIKQGARLFFISGATLYELIGARGVQPVATLSGNKYYHATINNGQDYVTFLTDGVSNSILSRGVLRDWNAGSYFGVDTVRAGSLSAAPPGTLLSYGLGRMWVANEQQVFMSEPNNPYLYHLGHGRITAEEEITCLAFVKNGFWLGTTAAIYYVQSDGVKFIRAEKAPYGCFKGTPPKVDAAQLPLQGIYGEGYIIPTQMGFAFVGQDGIFVNLTEKTFELRRSDLTEIAMTPYTATIERNRLVFCGGGYSLMMNLYNLAVTETTLYDMTDCAVHRSILHYGNSGGLYATALADITAEFTFQVNFPEPCRLRSIGITGEFEGQLYLDATVNETNTKTYQLNPIDGLKQTALSKVLRRDNGKGQHWKLRFYNGTSAKDFSIDTVKAETTNVSTAKGGYSF